MSFFQVFVEVTSWVAIVGGSAFMLVGAIGAWRFPDFWARIHAISVADSAGMLLLTSGMCIQGGFTLVTVKLIIIGVFLFITGPTATHAVANAAMVSGFLPRGADEFRNPKIAHDTKTRKLSAKKKSPSKGGL